MIPGDVSSCRACCNVSEWYPQHAKGLQTVDAAMLTAVSSQLPGGRAGRGRNCRGQAGPGQPLPTWPAHAPHSPLSRHSPTLPGDEETTQGADFQF